VLSVIRHRDGDRDIAIHDAADPQTITGTVSLTREEAYHVADLLSGTLVIDHVLGDDSGNDRIRVVRVPIIAGSPADGLPLGKLEVRRHVVAVLRNKQVITEPKSDLVLQHGDVLVVVGPAEVIATLEHVLTEH